MSIITVNYNGCSDTVAMLDSLLKIKFRHLIEVFVVDNGSRGLDADTIATAHSWVKVIRSEENLGFAGGNNLALDYANGDYILYLNNDTLIESDFIAPIIDFMESNPRCGLASPKILYNDDRRVHYAGFSLQSRSLRRLVALDYGKVDSGGLQQPQKTPFVHGAAMVSSRRMLEKVGPMCEEYFLYFEEMEYSLRAEREGFEVWYLPQSVVLHKGSATIGGLNSISAYYSARNYLYFISDNSRGIRRIALLADKLFVASIKTVVGYITTKRYDLIKSYIKALFDFTRGKRGKL